MNTFLKVILIIGLILTLSGACIFVTAIAASKWDLTVLSDTVTEYKTYTEPVGKETDTITLDFENADIILQFSADDDTLTIQYPQLFDKNGNEKTEITLTHTDTGITICEKALWYRNLISLWNFSTPQVVVTLPTERAYTLHIETNNGAISVNGISGACNEITLTTDNGKISTRDADLTCTRSLTLSTDNGKLELGKIHAQQLFAETDNGNLLANGSLYADRIEISSDNGSLVFNGDLSADTLLAETDNGSITISGILAASDITLESNVGSIRAYLAGKRSDYSVRVEHDLGNTNITSQAGGEKNLSVQTDIGNIEISFTEE